MRQVANPPYYMTMSYYSLAQSLLFKLSPEKAHATTLELMKRMNNWGIDMLFTESVKPLPIRVMGLVFPNPVGLAAGLDKNGEYIDALAAQGFGFIEIGTITPKAQTGNPTPRLFRLPQAQAIINRMGFNNVGVDRVIHNVRRTRYRGVLGINIGKNATTPNENAADDYITCLNKVYPYASYVAINISSPNTKDLRDLQTADALDNLLAKLKQRQFDLANEYSRYVPMAVKIAPDLEPDSIKTLAELLVRYRIDGVIATNTTVAREGVSELLHGDEQGGLSGAPLTQPATNVIQELSNALYGRIPIIGVGGIMSGSDALTKLNAGAYLLQLYSGLIYRGPELIRECVDAARPFMANPPTRASSKKMGKMAGPFKMGGNDGSLKEENTEDASETPTPPAPPTGLVT